MLQRAGAWGDTKSCGLSRLAVKFSAVSIVFCCQLFLPYYPVISIVSQLSPETVMYSDSLHSYGQGQSL